MLPSHERWKRSSGLRAACEPSKKLLKSVGFYNMPCKALKYLNKTFNKDSSNKAKDLNRIHRSTLVVKLTKKPCGEWQEAALLEMVRVAPKKKKKTLFWAQKMDFGKKPTDFFLSEAAGSVSKRSVEVTHFS